MLQKPSDAVDRATDFYSPGASAIGFATQGRLLAMRTGSFRRASSTLCAACCEWRFRLDQDLTWYRKWTEYKLKKLATNDGAVCEIFIGVASLTTFGFVLNKSIVSISANAWRRLLVVFFRNV